MALNHRLQRFWGRVFNARGTRPRDRWLGRWVHGLINQLHHDGSSCRTCFVWGLWRILNHVISYSQVGRCRLVNNTLHAGVKCQTGPARKCAEGVLVVICCLEFLTESISDCRNSKIFLMRVYESGGSHPVRLRKSHLWTVKVSTLDIYNYTPCFIKKRPPT